MKKHKNQPPELGAAGSIPAGRTNLNVKACKKLQAFFCFPSPYGSQTFIPA